ncbi:hypothetical protein [Rhizobium sp. Root482]|uniref:hypothetical protein n=1 Tax=Rhizobium sp. Root482 TaxID=1736543 RepID=UPI000700FD1D|nr:hypothetical protein [Rhizobium sp. Root482]KQY22545.1 hypothetical protein ASD31_22920 [Rhizobium sp. Root482]
MSDQTKSTKLVVLAAFDLDDEGNLYPAFEARQVDNAERAVREARMIADEHAGVVAWSRDADPMVGEYGPPTILYQNGQIPGME